MAHFAKLNENNVVTQVIVVSNLDCLDENGNESEAKGIEFCKSLYGQDSVWIQTSYSGSIRGKYAGAGDTYDAVNDVFVPEVVNVPTLPDVVDDTLLSPEPETPNLDN
jgi:hypothetical protein